MSSPFPHANYEQIILDGLAAWINKGGWFVLRRAHQTGIDLRAAVTHIELSTKGVHLTCNDQTFAQKGVQYALPDVTLRLIIRVDQQPTDHATKGPPQWVDAITIVAPPTEDHLAQWRQFTVLQAQTQQLRNAQAEQRRLAHIVATIKQAHPCLTDVRIGPTKDGGVVMIDLPDGTTITVEQANTGDDRHKKSTPILTIDGVPINKTV